MAQVTIVYWRDIPAQVIVGSGRKGAKRTLDERFEQTIDHIAMKAKVHDADSYLEDWRRVHAHDRDGDQAAIADAEKARLERVFDENRLKELIANDGWEPD
ncbi:MAG: virulence factor [Aestuariivita sp.]|nr:virulence factor [Aestuariivita sp.]MCY4203479.1 virulence factor [Aestuariivita sp.]MCY4289860.1 virulence factor [Aestuariivita sp.]MCY4348215.1 virulence factor [Aestuariivita sp.]